MQNTGTPTIHGREDVSKSEPGNRNPAQHCRDHQANGSAEHRPKHMACALTGEVQQQTEADCAVGGADDLQVPCAGRQDIRVTGEESEPRFPIGLFFDEKRGISESPFECCL